MTRPANPFLTAPLGRIYLRTAGPLILLMGLHGSIAVADAWFLGRYVGPAALAAVTVMFPFYMGLAALSTLVSTGMSSVLARHLGARRIEAARAVFAGAHGLSLLASASLILAMLAVGEPLALLAAGGDPSLAKMGLGYLEATAFLSALFFLVAIHSDALRNEGRIGFMTAMSVLVSGANIAFDYVLIAEVGLGVVGSAVATAAAQALALTVISIYRVRANTALNLGSLIRYRPTAQWGRVLALGTPQSLNFLGISLGSATILVALQIADPPNYEATISAYGLLTRLMIFAFLPLLGLSQAMQSITGNNFGAGHQARTDASLRTAVVAALLYCGAVQVGLTVEAAGIGALFAADATVIAEIARIIPIAFAAFALAGPLMIVAMHFTAIGDAARAGLLGLSKPYLFAIPLTFVLAAWVGEVGIWLAGPLAELGLLGLTGIVLASRARATGLRWGLFYQAKTPA